MYIVYSPSSTHHLIYIPNYSIVYNLVYSPYCELVNSAMGWLKCQLFFRRPQTLCGFKDGTTIGYSIYFHYPFPLFSFPFPYGSSSYASNCGTTYRKKTLTQNHMTNRRQNVEERGVKKTFCGQDNFLL